MADARDLKSLVRKERAGSTPAVGTNNMNWRQFFLGQKPIMNDTTNVSSQPSNEFVRLLHEKEAEEILKRRILAWKCGAPAAWADVVQFLPVGKTFRYLDVPLLVTRHNSREYLLGIYGAHFVDASMITEYYNYPSGSFVSRTWKEYDLPILEAIVSELKNRQL